MKVNQSTYRRLVHEDIAWLEANTDDALERRHLIEIARWSIDALYTIEATP